MVGTGSTHIGLKGTFTFSINQSGLNYRKKKEREEAIRDFRDCFYDMLRELENSEFSYLTLDYDEDNLKVEEGE